MILVQPQYLPTVNFFKKLKDNKIFVDFNSDYSHFLNINKTKNKLIIYTDKNCNYCKSLTEELTKEKIEYKKLLDKRKGYGPNATVPGLSSFQQKLFNKKLDKARKAYIMPLCCPNCGGVMNNKHDKKFYDLHGQCYNCVVELETQIKLAGSDLWEKYSNRIMNADIDGFIKDYTNYVYDQMSISNNSYITEAGDVEKWDGNIDRTRALKALNESIKNLEKLKK